MTENLLPADPSDDHARYSHVGSPKSAAVESPPELSSCDFDHELHPLDVLADEFSARCRKGEMPSIDEFERRAPEHRDAIRSLFPTIALLERVTQEEHSTRKAERRSVCQSKVDW